MGCPEAELSVSLIDDPAMAELAGRYGRPARPTDVLAFALREGPGAEHRGALLGDVVISLETAERQAAERGVSLDEELRDLVIHGALHVLGMDHERGPAAAREMRALEVQLRGALVRLESGPLHSGPERGGPRGRRPGRTVGRKAGHEAGRKRPGRKRPGRKAGRKRPGRQPGRQERSR